MAGYKNIDAEVGKGTRFKPGKSGNPDGGSKKTRMSAALHMLLEMSPKDREKYEPQNGYEQLAEEILKAATSGDGKFAVKTHAMALILSYVEQKPEPSDKEIEAIKSARVIVMDMPSPTVSAPTEPKQEKIN